MIGGGGDQVDDDLEGRQRSSAPIEADGRKHPVLNFVPLGRPRRKMAHGDRHLQFISEILHGEFPEPGTGAIAPAAIGRYQEALGIGVKLAPHAIPPLANALDGEFGGIVIGAHIDPARIIRGIIDPVRDRLAQLFVHKVVAIDVNGGLGRMVFAAIILKEPDQFFLFGIHGNDRIPEPLKLTGHLRNVGELPIPVGMVTAGFEPFPIGLHTIVILGEQLGHGHATDRHALGG